MEVVTARREAWVQEETPLSQSRLIHPMPVKATVRHPLVVLDLVRVPTVAVTAPRRHRLPMTGRQRRSLRCVVAEGPVLVLAPALRTREATARTATTTVLHASPVRGPAALPAGALVDLALPAVLALAADRQAGDAGRAATRVRATTQFESGLPPLQGATAWRGKRRRPCSPGPAPLRRGPAACPDTHRQRWLMQTSTCENIWGSTQVGQVRLGWIKARSATITAQEMTNGGEEEICSIQ